MAAPAEHKSVSVTIRYEHPGAQPPIYLAGSFSQPEWQPQEMEHTAKGDNEYEFRKDVRVEEGKEYQYKFRIGEGHWWTLDEDAPVVTDNVGNRNNVFRAPVRKEQEEAQRKQANTLLSAMPTSQAPGHVDGMDDTASKGYQEKINLGEEPKLESTETLHVSNNSQAENSELTYPPATNKHILPVNGESTERADYSRDYPQVLDTKNSPALIVDKADVESRPGDDPNAGPAVGPEDTRHLRAQDEEPDIVSIRSEVHTPELANVAAEVADSAAMLDRGQPTPPISDEEAGRIGFRRMSSTPIPEVADTAAEVADVAAKLDRETLSPDNFPPKPSTLEVSDHLPESGASTPWEEKAPLFAHENPGPNEKTVQPVHRDSPMDLKPTLSPKIVADDEIDYNDPSLKQFPSTRAGILAELKSIERRLSVDDSLAEGVPPSPMGRQPPQLELAVSSTVLLATEENSPSLDSITEETELPKRLSSPADASQSATASNENHGVESKDPASEAEAEKIGQEPRSCRLFEKSQPRGTSKARHESGIGTPEASSESDINERSDQGAGIEEVDTDTSGEAQDTPTSSHSQTKNEAKRICIPERSSSNTANRQLGDDERVREISTGDDGPNITVQPATPGSSMRTEASSEHRNINEYSDKPTYTPKSSDTAHENRRSQLTSRKQRRPPSPNMDRPVTPTSIRSSHKEVKSRNFLKTFFHAIFVDWIGGLIMRLCGGGRHTLLAISALAILVPALYWFYA